MMILQETVLVRTRRDRGLLLIFFWWNWTCVCRRGTDAMSYLARVFSILWHVVYLVFVHLTW
jgi:hypothetical protein